MWISITKDKMFSSVENKESKGDRTENKCLIPAQKL